MKLHNILFSVSDYQLKPQVLRGLKQSPQQCTRKREEKEEGEKPGWRSVKEEKITDLKVETPPKEKHTCQHPDPKYYIVTL